MSVRTRVGSTTTLLAERGCFVIADISGYTGYVVESPLEHAEDVLTDVTALVAEHLGRVLSLNKQEGDAIFGYALEGSTARCSSTRSMSATSPSATGSPGSSAPRAATATPAPSSPSST